MFEIEFQFVTNSNKKIDIVIEYQYINIEYRNMNILRYTLYLQLAGH